MSLQAAIQTKLNKATEAYGAARSILDAHPNGLPDEKQVEVDRAFADFDRLMAEVKQLEKAGDRERQLAEMNQPQNDLNAPKGMPGVPGGGGPSADESIAYMKAWDRALRGGARVLTQTEAKALRADEDPSGGFLVAPRQVVTMLIKDLDDAVIMRRLGTVYPLERAESLGVPVLDNDLSDPEWTSELATGSEDTIEPFAGRELKASPLAKRIKVSKKLLRQSTINVEQLIRQRFAYKFGVAQEKGFMVGTGNNQPLGLFTLGTSTYGIGSGRDVVAAAATVIAGDDLIDAKFKLKPAYWPRSRWVLHRDVLKAARKLKDNNDNYLWSPGLGPGGGLTQGLPATLVDTPYEISEFAPNSIASGKYVAAIGDMSFYWIAEALSMEIQVVMELYAEKNQVGYIGRMEVDGMPIHDEPFARLKMA